MAGKVLVLRVRILERARSDRETPFTDPYGLQVLIQQQPPFINRVLFR